MVDTSDGGGILKGGTGIKRRRTPLQIAMEGDQVILGGIASKLGIQKEVT